MEIIDQYQLRLFCPATPASQKIVVTTWLRPSIPVELLSDQYGFRPTGSTTAALVHLFHSITKMLESCGYVRAVLIDFTKAFDTVDHTSRGLGVNFLPAKGFKRGPPHCIETSFSYRYCRLKTITQVYC